MEKLGEQFSRLVRRRKTVKVLAGGEKPVVHSDEVTTKCNQLVLESIADAGFAPFHYARGVDDLVEPWRFHILWQDECRIVGNHLAEWYPDMKPSNKLPPMLAACGALVIVNWLPQFQAGADQAAEESAEKQIQVDEEHLAATASATQNLLLSLTARGLRTYWSSGGFFRRSSMFERLGIPLTERLLAAVFVDYGKPESTEEIFGKNAESRSEYSRWTRVVKNVAT